MALRVSSVSSTDSWAAFESAIWVSGFVTCIPVDVRVKSGCSRFCTTDPLLIAKQILGHRMPIQRCIDISFLGH